MSKSCQYILVKSEFDRELPAIEVKSMIVGVLFTPSERPGLTSIAALLPNDLDSRLFGVSLRVLAGVQRRSASPAFPAFALYS